ncbi:50S ribosomal protein L9 [Paenibacillus gansuensis]|uniref:Large ribosomal subunit protein bL9 n=1 Tax=Paenibacillus gansuensis TaxID=306542 RepID=A0ABW5PIL2_9BACL
MRVIFLKDVKGQGKKGDIKDLSEGYVNNFLLPKGLVKAASEGNVKTLEQQTISEGKRKEKEKQDAQELAAKVEAMTISIKSKIGKDGRLFGSITSKQIAEELAARQIKVDKRKIELADPIRTLGITEVPVKLHPEVKATVKVHITEE